MTTSPSRCATDTAPPPACRRCGREAEYIAREDDKPEDRGFPCDVYLCRCCHRGERILIVLAKRERV